MPQKSGMSKVFAVVFAVLTVAVIGGIVTMISFFKIQSSDLNMTAAPTFQPTTTAPPPVMRLPKNVVPELYELVIQPQFYIQFPENVTDLNYTMFFNGTSTVHFHCVERTWSIYLNSENLTVVEPLVMWKDKNERINSSLKSYEDESNFLEVQLTKPLEAGANYSLQLVFQGIISRNLESLFVSRYNERDTGSVSCLVATNMQPIDARKMFPCFDEPEMKAEFAVTVIHRDGSTVLGNMDVSSSDLINGWIHSKFTKTPRMSTYLVAFVVSDFTSEESHHSRVKIKTYARPGATAAGETKYASEITPKILDFYEKYFDIEYNLGKLDQIALPDLYPGAMENWGLITYQEGSLLYKENVSSLLHKEMVASYIAHELAHQWFGNLVTMKWWNEIWLNEGFATYMANVAVDAVEPTFKIKDLMFMKHLHGAFLKDSLVSSHPLSAPAQNVQKSFEITAMFDAITYSKGAMVLRMLADYVKENIFLSGIRSYLKAFAYRNTDQNDLWEYIQKAYTQSDDISIAEYMNPWTTQPGYPVVTINTVTGETYQKQFLFNDTAESSLWWPIRINYMTSTSSDSTIVWLNKNEPGKEVKTDFRLKVGEWILANINYTGYYRVNYDTGNWERLLTQLEKDLHLIPLLNRGQLIDDAFNFARAKLVDVTLALNLTRFLKNDTEFLPWESAVRNLEYFFFMFDRSEVYGPMQVYLREQVRGFYNFFRNETDSSRVPDDYTKQYSQILAIQVACSNGLPECVDMATKQYADWMNNENSTNTIHPNLRSEIYCQAVAAGGKKEWEFAWNKFLSATDVLEKNQLQGALACTKEIWLLNRYLEYALDPEQTSLMDVTAPIVDIAKNSAGQALAWDFIRAHRDYISQGDWPYLLASVTRRFSTPFELEELQHFMDELLMDQEISVISMSEVIEQTQVNIQWVQENRDVILQWFEREAAAAAAS